MRNRIVSAVAVAVVAGLVSLWGAPGAPTLADRSTGDAGLAAETRAAIDDPEGYRGLAVALVENGQVRTAGLGARGPDGDQVRPDTPFEIGSVGKTLTGMLLAERVAAGAVRPEDQLRTLLPELTGPTGEVTLAELASHRSGLPRVPVTSPVDVIGSWWANVRAADPYAGEDRDRILRLAAEVEPGKRRGEVNYSNFGMALLGQGLAAQAGQAYPELVTERILGPLGMQRTTFALDGAELPAGHASGGTARGRATAPWTGSGWAPAGVGIWSTADDLGKLVAAMLAGTAPGADAATPRFDEDDRSRIGYGWFTDRYDDREVVWHNGATGGFKSYVGYERATGRGVVLLGNTDQDLRPAALRLLGVAQPPTGGSALTDWVGGLIAIGFSLFGAVSLFLAARRGPDRLGLVSAALGSAVLLLVAYRLGDWLLVPGWVWSVGVGLTAAALLRAGLRWRALPLVGGPKRRWWRWTETALSVAVSLLATFALLS